MKILVVGNGSIGVDNDSSFFINNHTGYFLQGISEKHTVSFTQNTTIYDQNNNLQNFDLITHNLDFELLPNKKSLSFLPKLLSLVTNNEFLYIFYPGTLGKIIGLMAIMLRKPIGLYIRGQYYNQGIIDRIILKYSKFILTVSPSLSNDLLTFCDTVDVIRPMISIELDDLKLDRNYNSPQTWNLLFVGRVEERKGINELLHIAKHLKFNDFNFILNIVGGGDLFEEVKTNINQLGLQNNVILHGLISDKDELKAMYDDANAFIFTSHDEGFPRVLYEAMASGLPIFTTFVGGISGRMEHLSNCIEIPVKDSAKAGVIVNQYLDQVRVLEKVGKKGQETLQEIINGSLLSHADLLLKNLINEK
ncbi:glycosyltransferase family 4 protein [Algoriphagus antarcticus]|uniref:Glycosyl transferase family 1 n=1 Tax=Algoriphagus antarcticus TaxID=238540 RepID=A0A3E0D474_9BACT|nr:glycosyltransferase family 4 protein [Algoriphagus antarcticus]REG77486.1 glycosyl transferase family 1 [Algoriphagus antarcticus]